MLYVKSMRKEIDKDPYKDISVSRIEQKKFEEKNSSKQHFSYSKKQNIFVATVLFLVEKFSNIFFKNFQKEAKLLQLTKALKDLKNGFEKLKEKDLSQDTLFLKELSNSFKLLIKEKETLSFLKNKKNKKLDFFIEKIKNFYSKQEYPLSYYLLNYKEENWHPFPFIKMLNSLYLEHQTNKNSHLNIWTANIENILVVK